MTTIEMPISRDASLPDPYGLVIACGEYARRMAQRVIEVRSEFRHRAVVQSSYWTDITFADYDFAAAVEVGPAGESPRFDATDVRLAAQAIDFAATHAQRRQVRSGK